MQQPPWQSLYGWHNRYHLTARLLTCPCGLSPELKVKSRGAVKLLSIRASCSAANVCRKNSPNLTHYVCNFMFVWMDESRVLYTAEYSQAPTNMWQSRVEIKGYSVMYFDRIAVFEAPYHWTSVKDGAHMCFMDALISNESMKHIWAPPFKGSDVIEICDGITFDFYVGLPLHHIPKQHCFSFSKLQCHVYMTGWHMTFTMYECFTCDRVNH